VKPRALLLVLTLAVSTVAGAEVRQAPPPREAPPPRVAPPTRVVPAVGFNASTNGYQVEIFVASWCPYCHTLERELSARGISYTRSDIEHDPAAKRRYDQLGKSGLPVTRVGSQVIVGARLDAILAALGRTP
jgi:glutaredoxin